MIRCGSDYPAPNAILVADDAVRPLLEHVVPPFCDTYVVARKNDRVTYSCRKHGFEVQVDACYVGRDCWMIMVWVEYNDMAIRHGVALGDALLRGGGRLCEGSSFVPGLIAPPITWSFSFAVASVAILVLGLAVLLLAQLP